MKLLEKEIDLQSLSKNEKKVAAYVSKNLARVLLMTQQEIADELRVSTATVSRFWRALGYDTFKAFKKQVKTAVPLSNPADKMKDILQRVEEKDVFQEMIALTGENLQKTSEKLSRQVMNEVVEVISQKRVIYLYASGPAECLTSFLSFRLNRLNYLVGLIPSSGHALFETLVNIKPEDVVFVFGFSKVLPEQQVILQQGREVGFTTILMTDLPFSELMELSSYVLPVERGEAGAFHSMVPPLLLVEALVVSLARKKEAESVAGLEKLHRLRKKYRKYLPG